MISKPAENILEGSSVFSVTPSDLSEPSSKTNGVSSDLSEPVEKDFGNSYSAAEISPAFSEPPSALEEVQIQDNFCPMVVQKQDRRD